MINLVFAAGDTRVIKMFELNIADLTLKIDNSEYLINNSIIDPLTRNNVSGYIITDNVVCSINLSNRDIINKPFRLESYYYTLYKGKYIKVRCKDYDYNNGTIINIVPNNTYPLLKSTNRILDTLFVIDVNYDVINNNAKEEVKKLLIDNENINSETIISEYLNENNMYIDANDNYVESRNKKFYFKIVSNKEYLMYKNLEKKDEEENSKEIKRPKKQK